MCLRYRRQRQNKKLPGHATSTVTALQSLRPPAAVNPRQDSGHASPLLGYAAARHRVMELCWLGWLVAIDLC